jgi:hypothetical protein
MTKQLKITRITICIIALVMCTGFSFAKGGDDDEKEKLKEKEKLTVVHSDSANTNLDVNAAHHVDDTLVFEDWDGQGGGSDDDGGIGQSNGGSADLDGDNTGFKYGVLNEATSENPKEFYDQVFRKEYRVEFTIYPNPTTDYITIETNVTPQSMRVIDMTGKAHRKEGYSSRIDVTELPSGTYILNLIYADHLEARRFIKR